MLSGGVSSAFLFVSFVGAIPLLFPPYCHTLHTLTLPFLPWFQVASIISLRELRGLSVSLQKAASSVSSARGSVAVGVSEEIKSSLVRMADNYDKLFIHELVHTQLFEAFYTTHIRAWFVEHPLPPPSRSVVEGGGTQSGARAAADDAAADVCAPDATADIQGDEQWSCVPVGEDSGGNGQEGRGEEESVDDADTPTSEKSSSGESTDEDSEDDDEEDGEFISRNKHNCTVKVLTDEVAGLTRKLKQSQMEKALLEEARDEEMKSLLAQIELLQQLNKNQLAGMSGVGEPRRNQASRAGHHRTEFSSRSPRRSLSNPPASASPTAKAEPRTEFSSRSPARRRGTLHQTDFSSRSPSPRPATPPQDAAAAGLHARPPRLVSSPLRSSSPAAQRGAALLSDLRARSNSPFRAMRVSTDGGTATISPPQQTQRRHAVPPKLPEDEAREKEREREKQQQQQQQRAAAVVAAQGMRGDEMLAHEATDSKKSRRRDPPQPPAMRQVDGASLHTTSASDRESQSESDRERTVARGGMGARASRDSASERESASRQLQRGGGEGVGGLGVGNLLSVEGSPPGLDRLRKRSASPSMMAARAERDRVREREREALMQREREFEMAASAHLVENEDAARKGKASRGERGGAGRDGRNTAAAQISNEVKGPPVLGAAGRSPSGAYAGSTARDGMGENGAGDEKAQRLGLLQERERILMAEIAAAKEALAAKAAPKGSPGGEIGDGVGEGRGRGLERSGAEWLEDSQSREEREARRRERRDRREKERGRDAHLGGKMMDVLPQHGGLAVAASAHKDNEVGPTFAVKGGVKDDERSAGVAGEGEAVEQSAPKRGWWGVGELGGQVPSEGPSPSILQKMGSAAALVAGGAGLGSKGGREGGQEAESLLDMWQSVWYPPPATGESTPVQVWSLSCLMPHPQPLLASCNSRARVPTRVGSACNWCLRNSRAASVRLPSRRRGKRAL